MKLKHFYEKIHWHKNSVLIFKSCFDIYHNFIYNGSENKSFVFNLILVDEDDSSDGRPHLSSWGHKINLSEFDIKRNNLTLLLWNIWASSQYVQNLSQNCIYRSYMIIKYEIQGKINEVNNRTLDDNWVHESA